MKILKIIAVITCFTVMLFCGGCSPKGIAGGAKNPVEELIDLCSENNYNEASKHMQYHGSDKARLNKDTANYATDDEGSKKEVEVTCSKIRGMKNSQYKVGAERTERGAILFDVDLNANGTTINQIWAFTKINGSYVFLDMDKKN